MRVEDEDRVGQEPDRGLEATGDQDEHRVEQLLLGEPVALVAGPDQGAEEIFGRRRTLGVDLTPQVRHDLFEGRRDLLRGAAAGGHGDLKPGVQPLPVIRGQP